MKKLSELIREGADAPQMTRQQAVRAKSAAIWAVMYAIGRTSNRDLRYQREIILDATGVDIAAPVEFRQALTRRDVINYRSRRWDSNRVADYLETVLGL